MRRPTWNPDGAREVRPSAVVGGLHGAPNNGAEATGRGLLKGVLLAQLAQPQVAVRGLQLAVAMHVYLRKQKLGNSISDMYPIRARLRCASEEESTRAKRERFATV